MRTFLALIASLGLVGCVGGIETPGTEDPDDGGTGGGGTGDAAVQAKKLFETNVHPVIATNCVGCHNKTGPQGNITGFVSPNLQDAYATTVGYQAVIGDWTPTGAPILTKITATTKTPSHQGINYSNDALNKITEWLAMELTARGTGGATNPQGENASQITTRLLQEWSGCMTLVNFEAGDMREWGNVNAGGGGDCRTCHSQGEYGHIASNTSTLFFPYITEDKYYMLQYFAVDLSAGLAAAKVIINDRSFEGVGNRLAPHQQHPNFNPTNNNGYAALQQFYNTTASAKTAAGGVCGPTKLLN